ncbi:MAG TPA: CBS domain-containing protein [Anaerolineae bacterium]|nr:CBS domain-containing protein [Anaerolineae bacterium]HOQ97393.1 CBS domain-containing protein [Anaerolineae bacterium]HPL29783.1 CBS domain-containing protein [Anaerolineae bacterium]
MKIREIMTTDVVSVPSSATIMEAARLMRDADIGDVLIQDSNQLMGILTDRDIACRAVAEGLDCAGARVGDIMSRDLFTGMPDWDVNSASDLMAEEQIRRLPIMENGKLVGIVSLGDLAVDAEPTQQGVACDALEEISKPAMPRLGAIRK